VRRGAFKSGIATGVSGLFLISLIFAIPSGVLQNPTIGLSLVTPMVLAGLLIGRRALTAAIVISLASLAILATLELPPYELVGFGRTPSNSVATLIISMSILYGMIGFVLGQFSRDFRGLLVDLTERQQSLESLQAGLERTVGERTTSLEAALREGELREARLEGALADLQASRATIRELSAPVIPVLSGVLVMPLVGTLDEQRANEFAESLLSGVTRLRAHTVIIDVTGVPLIDTQVARTLIQASSAIRLLGARTLLVGIRPEVAQTLVSLGVDLGGIPTHADLQGAIASFIGPASAQRQAARAG
jgi:rsbT co-antagonist protein RsbR